MVVIQVQSKNCGAEAQHRRITNVFIPRFFLLFYSCWSKPLPFSLQNTSAIEMHCQKHFLNRFFNARPHFQSDQDDGLPVRVYGLTDLQTYAQCHDIKWLRSLKGGSSHKNLT